MVARQNIYKNLVQKAFPDTNKKAELRPITKRDVYYYFLRTKTALNKQREEIEKIKEEAFLDVRIAKAEAYEQHLKAKNAQMEIVNDKQKLEVQTILFNAELTRNNAQQMIKENEVQIMIKEYEMQKLIDDANREEEKQKTLLMYAEEQLKTSMATEHLMLLSESLENQQKVVNFLFEKLELESNMRKREIDVFATVRENDIKQKSLDAQKEGIENDYTRVENERRSQELDAQEREMDSTLLEKRAKYNYASSRRMQAMAKKTLQYSTTKLEYEQLQENLSNVKYLLNQKVNALQEAHEELGTANAAIMNAKQELGMLDEIKEGKK